MSLRSGLVWEILRAGVRNRVGQVFLKVVKRSMDRSSARQDPDPEGACGRFTNRVF
jgi:hypothetical protein